MTQLAKNLMCVQMRSGVEIWMEQVRVEKLQQVLRNITSHKFVDFDEQTINTADVVGVFNATSMDEHTRRKNGQWKCDSGEWHDRGAKCECLSITEKDFLKKRAEAVAKCGQCKNGHLWIQSSNTFVLCKCMRELEANYEVKK